MPADPLLAALDDALECPQVAHLPRGDRLALALWWLIESVADDFKIPPEQAADEVAMLCGLAKEMVGMAVVPIPTIDSIGPDSPAYASG